MADKPVLKYTVTQRPNRATGGVIYVPAIVQRDESIPLDEITIRAGEAPPTPSEPTLTEAYTAEHTEETDKDKAYGDGDLEVHGTNLTGATVKLQFEGVSGQPYEETVPAEKLDIRSDGTGFTIDGTWLTANVLSNMSQDDTFLMIATTTAGNAELTVTNKYSA